MPAHTIIVSEHHERVIGEVVGSGRYDDASEVVHEALRLFEEIDRNEEAKSARFLALIAEGEAAYARGDYIEIADDELDDWLDSLTTAVPIEPAR